MLLIANVLPMTTCYYFFINKSLTRKSTAALTAILQEFQSCCIGVGNSEMFLSRLIVNYCKRLLFDPINDIRTRRGIPRSPIHFQLPSILNIIYLRNVDFLPFQSFWSEFDCWLNLVNSSYKKWKNRQGYLHQSNLF